MGMGRIFGVGAVACALACGSGNPPAGVNVSSATGSGGAASVTSTGASGSCDNGAGGAAMLVADKGCDPKMAVDMTGKPEVEIKFGYIDSKFVYTPKCAKVSPCTKVTFRCGGTNECNFSMHPLQGGAGAKADPASPFGFTFDPNLTEKSFVLKNKGSFPYICASHYAAGMVGTVFVQ